MFRIKRKKSLNPTVTLMEVEAPLIAKKAKAGQFIILRVDDSGERIPLTIADYDRDGGTITIIFQIVGATTEKLNRLEEGEFIHDFVGPLGVASHTEGFKKVAVIGGGVGCAIAYPTAKALKESGAEVHSIVGFRNRDLVILEDETKKNIAHFIPKRNTSSGGVSSVKTEIDLRGMMLEEALNETDMFLDRSIMAGLGTVTIIHGKGTGTLRAGIQDMLRRHPQVKSYRNGRYGEGENGVTVVELKNS